MNVFIDGRFVREAMPVAGDPGLPLSQLVSRSDIHAIEIYPTVNSVPIEFTRIGPSTNSGRAQSRIPSPNRPMSSRPVENDDAACGTIVIWTKAFAERRQAP